MSWMISLSRAIDGVTERVGRMAAWLVLVAVVISAGNAISRKAFSLSSNAWLEMQWYLFGAVFMLGAAWTLKRNEHIRIDILSSRMPKGFRDWLEIIGHAFFLYSPSPSSTSISRSLSFSDLPIGRGLDECRRADDLAGEIADPRRLRPAAGPGIF